MSLPQINDVIYFHYPNEDDEVIHGTVEQITIDKTWGNVYQIRCSDYLNSWNVFIMEPQMKKLFVRTTSNPFGSCECGSEKLGHPGHSDFCPKFKKDQ